MLVTGALLVLLLGWRPLAASPPSMVIVEAAACFSDTGGAGDIGVWIYEGCSDWRQARESPKSMLVFGFKPGRTDYPEAELAYCWYSADVGAHKITLCQSGTLLIRTFEPRDRIVGRYSFALQDGSKKEGEFTASFCPKK